MRYLTPIKPTDFSTNKLNWPIYGRRLVYDSVSPWVVAPVEWSLPLTTVLLITQTLNEVLK